MRLILALFLIILTADAGEAEHLWVNNITVNQYGMTWNYTETFTGVDSIVYRVSIDADLGNNDSFVNAWELLNADKEMRKNLRSSIDKEFDVKINNGTGRVELIDVGSTLSPAAIGNTHSMETIVNIYSVNYRFGKSVLNASEIWFLGQSKSPVTIVMPPGVEVTNSSGMENITRNITDHAEVSGFFKELSKDRGEITLALSRNTSFSVPEASASNINPTMPPENTTKPMTEALSKIRDASIVAIGLVIILLIYFFKLKRR